MDKPPFHAQEMESNHLPYIIAEKVGTHTNNTKQYVASKITTLYLEVVTNSLRSTGETMIVPRDRQDCLKLYISGELQRQCAKCARPDETMEREKLFD